MSSKKMKSKRTEVANKIVTVFALLSLMLPTPATISLAYAQEAQDTITVTKQPNPDDAENDAARADRAIQPRPLLQDEYSSEAVYGISNGSDFEIEDMKNPGKLHFDGCNPDEFFNFVCGAKATSNSSQSIVQEMMGRRLGDYPGFKEQSYRDAEDLFRGQYSDEYIREYTGSDDDWKPNPRTLINDPEFRAHCETEIKAAKEALEENQVTPELQICAQSTPHYRKMFEKKRNSMFGEAVFMSGRFSVVEEKFRDAKASALAVVKRQLADAYRVSFAVSIDSFLNEDIGKQAQGAGKIEPSAFKKKADLLVRAAVGRMIRHLDSIEINPDPLSVCTVDQMDVMVTRRSGKGPMITVCPGMLQALSTGKFEEEKSAALMNMLTRAIAQAVDSCEADRMTVGHSPKVALGDMLQGQRACVVERSKGMVTPLGGGDVPNAFSDSLAYDQWASARSVNDKSAPHCSVPLTQTEIQERKAMGRREQTNNLVAQEFANQIFADWFKKQSLTKKNKNEKKKRNSVLRASFASYCTMKSIDGSGMPSDKVFMNECLAKDQHLRSAMGCKLKEKIIKVKVKGKKSQKQKVSMVQPKCSLADSFRKGMSRYYKGLILNPDWNVTPEESQMIEEATEAIQKGSEEHAKETKSDLEIIDEIEMNPTEEDSFTVNQGGPGATGGQAGATGGQAGATGGQAGADGDAPSGQAGATGGQAGADGDAPSGQAGATGGQAGAGSDQVDASKDVEPAVIEVLQKDLDQKPRDGRRAYIPGPYSPDQVVAVVDGPNGEKVNLIDVNGDGYPDAYDRGADGKADGPYSDADRNYDGVVDEEEKKRYLKENPDAGGDLNKDGKVDNIEKDYDLNGDGVVDLNEKERFAEEQGRRARDLNKDGKYDNREETFDVNKDGIIDEKEKKADKNGDGIVDEEERKKFAKENNLDDKDNDGKVSAKDESFDLNKDGVADHKERKADVNNDGVVDENEQKKFRDRNPEYGRDTDGDRREDAYEVAADKNKDGVVSPEELADYKKNNPDAGLDINGDGEVSEVERAHDTNGNGVIDQEERESYARSHPNEDVDISKSGDDGKTSQGQGGVHSDAAEPKSDEEGMGNDSKPIAKKNKVARCFSKDMFGEQTETSSDEVRNYCIDIKRRDDALTKAMERAQAECAKVTQLPISYDQIVTACQVKKVNRIDMNLWSQPLVFNESGFGFSFQCQTRATQCDDRARIIPYYGEAAYQGVVSGDVKVPIVDSNSEDARYIKYANRWATQQIAFLESSKGVYAAGKHCLQKTWTPDATSAQCKRDDVGREFTYDTQFDYHSRIAGSESVRMTCEISCSCSDFSCIAKPVKGVQLPEDIHFNQARDSKVPVVEAYVSAYSTDEIVQIGNSQRDSGASSPDSHSGAVGETSQRVKPAEAVRAMESDSLLLDKEYLNRRLAARQKTEVRAKKYCSVSVERVPQYLAKNGKDPASPGNYFCGGQSEKIQLLAYVKEDLSGTMAKFSVKEDGFEFSYQCIYDCAKKECTSKSTDAKAFNGECAFTSYRTEVGSKTKDIQTRNQYLAAKNHDAVVLWPKMRSTCDVKKPKGLPAIIQESCGGNSQGAPRVHVFRDRSVHRTAEGGDLTGSVTNGAGLLFTCEYECDCKKKSCELPNNRGPVLIDLADGPDGDWTKDVELRRNKPSTWDKN